MLVGKGRRFAAGLVLLDVDTVIVGDVEIAGCIDEIAVGRDETLRDRADIFVTRVLEDGNLPEIGNVKIGHTSVLGQRHVVPHKIRKARKHREALGAAAPRVICS